MTQDLSPIDSLAQGGLSPAGGEMLFILVAIVLLGGIAALLFVAVRQGRMLRVLVEDIHHDLISFKSTADMNSDS
ncbi:MAG: hypothetical protein FD149_214 [Rhodospirillaceae bacterium]|nr:MAG: hypothetical protein FD149_214 [Rhodospirillaceae bacterium]